MNGVRHLRMGYVIVDEHTLNEGGVCKWPPTFPSTFIISEDTPFRSRSATVTMASIVIRANFSCAFEALQMRNQRHYQVGFFKGEYILLPRLVIAALNRVLVSPINSMVSDMQYRKASLFSRRGPSPGGHKRSVVGG